jgi:autotransporter-associated beta strand protein
MKKDNRGGTPVAAILLVSMVGSVCALSRMFQSPLALRPIESDLQFDEAADTRAAVERATVAFQQSLGHTAPAWLTNAMAAYSSGSARIAWYSLLDSSGDRRVSEMSGGSYNTTSSSSYLRFDTSSIAPLTGFVVGASSRGTSSITTPNAPTATKYWDATAGAGNGVGGSATWTFQTDLRWSTTITGDAALSAAATTDAGIFDGTAGTVTIGGDLTLASWTFNTTNYVLTPNSGAPRTLTGPFSLAAGVNLNIGLATRTTDSPLSLVGDGITGGAGSGITLQGAQVITDGRSVRLLLSQTGAFIDVPIAFGGAGTTAAGVVANAAGTGVTGTITNNSGFTTLLGATTAANDLTLSPTAVISGTAGVRIGTTATGANVGTVTINSPNSYSGGTTLDGGTLVLGNDTALGTNTLTLSNSATSVLQAGPGGTGTSARTLANNIVWGGDGTFSGINAFTLNGTLTSSGSATRKLIVNNTGGVTINGNVFLAPDNTTAGGLNFQGSTGITVNGVIANNNAGNSTASTLTYSGTSTLKLTNSNTYTGGTTINAGTVTAGSTTAIGNGSLTFDNGSTGKFQLNGFNISVTDLSFSQTFSGSPIIENGAGTDATLTVSTTTADAFAGLLRDGSTGKLGLTLNGGNLILYNTNTYTGNTTINAGTLTFNSATSPTYSGSANNSTIFLGSTTANSATATLTLGGNPPNMITSPVTVQPSAGTQGTRLFNSTAVSGTNTYGGNITMNTGLTLESSTGGTFLFQGGTINVRGNTLTVDSQANFNGADAAGVRGTIVINELLTTTNGSPGGLIKDGGGTLILQNVNNSYTGTNVFAVFNNTVATRIAGGTLGIYADNSLGLAPINPADNIYFVQSAASNPTADHILQGTGGNISLSALRQISVASGVTATFDNAGNTFTIGGVIHGSGDVATKGTNGSVTLTNANTYAGGTTVQSGTLFVNNASGSGTGSGAVTVNNSGTLAGSGFINAGSNDVSINGGGSVAPGSAANTIGALTLTAANVTFGDSLVSAANPAVFVVDISGASVDLLSITGILNLVNMNDKIQFNVGQPLTLPSYTLATYTNFTGIFNDFSTVPSGYALVYNLNELDLVATPVPEPSTWIGAALALLAVGYTQRRRFAKRSQRQTL